MGHYSLLSWGTPHPALIHIWRALYGRPDQTCVCRGSLPVLSIEDKSDLPSSLDLSLYFRAILKLHGEASVNWQYAIARLKIVLDEPKAFDLSLL